MKLKILSILNRVLAPENHVPLVISALSIPTLV